MEIVIIMFEDKLQVASNFINLYVFFFQRFIKSAY